MISSRILPALGVSLLFALHAFADEPIRVACMGDSITQGAKVNATTESYPAQLQKRLGEKFAVKNFGLGGATMWHGGKPTAFQELEPAKAFQPQIVIIDFGINDTRSRDVDYWGHFPEFTADTEKVLTEMLDLPTHPKVLLCLPTANFADLPGMPDERKSNVAERLPRLVQVRDTLREIAKRFESRGVSVVDLNAATEHHPEDFNVDGVHLTAAGYGLLAEALQPRVTEAAVALAK